MARWASAKRARGHVAGTVRYGINNISSIGLAFGSRRKEPPLTFLTYSQSVSETLMVVQAGPGCHSDAPLLPPEPWIRDAADECKHGRLPGDRTPPCGCW